MPRAACAAIYEVAVVAAAALGQSTLPLPTAATLQAALDEGARQAVAAERAWIYRRAIDKVYGSLAASIAR